MRDTNTGIEEISSFYESASECIKCTQFERTPLSCYIKTSDI